MAGGALLLPYRKPGCEWGRPFGLGLAAAGRGELPVCVGAGRTPIWWGMVDLVLRSRRVVVGGEERGATVAIRGGAIVAVGDYDDEFRSAAELDLGELALLP